MNIKTTGDRAETVRLTVRNDESSASLAVGDPVCFAMDGTEDGLAVVLPSSSTAAKATNFFAGVVTEAASQDLPKVAEVQVFGLCRKAKIRTATRAASTDNWASFTSWALGDRLALDSVNNAFSRSDAGVLSVIPAYAAVAETIASVASSASATSDARTAVTTYAKVFLRAL